MSLWFSIALAALAVVVAVPTAVHELALRRTQTTGRRRTVSAKTRARALITFLVLIIIAQFLVFLTATNRMQRLCADGQAEPARGTVETGANSPHR